jgi:tetratricopeptide (TPR) repeat protein/nucleoside phosphorylase
MSDWTKPWRRADVVILTALRLEYDAVLQVDAGVVHGWTWERTTGPNALPLAFRSFEAPTGRPLRVAVAVAADMGAVAATHTLLPLVEALKPRCIAMCGVCAGRPNKTQLGDVVAASRLFYHDTGKRLPNQIQRDLTTYQLRDDWKAALAGMDVVARFRDEAWFQARPLTTVWRERRALLALHNGDAAPWRDLDQRSWAATVAALREQKLLANTGRELTDEGCRVVDDLLFSYQGRLPDLSPAGDFQPFRLHVGPLASGSQVIEDEAIWDSISQSVRTTLALEMEGAALGQLAHCQRQYGLDAVVMKGVMDFADRGRDDHFKSFAARASAECLLAFLRDHVPTELVAGFDDLLTPGTSPAPDHTPSPSSLLVARHSVVPWHDRGRAQNLAELDAWADEPRRDVAVRLLHAAGGAGKTRLAIEWVRRRRERHDVAGFLGPHSGEHWLDRLCGLGAPVLIVLDYAESRPDLVELLDRLARYADGPGPRRRVRMLLLARGDGDWWTELQARSDAIRALLSHAAPIALSPVATIGPDRDAVFAEAARVFAVVLGKPAVLRPPIALADPRFERVLYLHMAALAAVEDVAFDAGTLMDAILDHEQRFWQTEAVALGQAAVSVELAQELVSAATLRGGIPTKDDAQDICTRLARRPRSREDDTLIAVLRHVYRHAGEPRFLPGLEPDLLGEAMVVRVAKARPDTSAPAHAAWVERLFVSGDDEHALTTAFMVLGRASATDGAPVRAWIASLLEIDLSVRAVIALRAAKIVGQRTAFSLLGEVLAEALEQHGTAALANVLDQEQIPYPTVSLQRVASWRSQTLLDSAGAGTDDSSMAQRARLFGQRGIDLAEAGQREQALVASREAVALYRTLATHDTKTFQPLLAVSLNNVGADLSSLGQLEAALEATREAVNLRRALATRNPDAFQPDLATSLNNLGTNLGDLGQFEAALAATREAVTLYRALAIRSPDVFQPDLAMSLNNLGNWLSALGQREAALAAGGEAVDLYRALAMGNPDAFQPALATSLNNLGTMLRSQGQREAALAASGEAVELYRALAPRNPDAFQPGLASGLNNLGTMLSALGQCDAAVAAAREAIEIYRELARRNPDAFGCDLAGSLDNLSNWLSDIGLRESALAATNEAVTLCRELARRSPDAFLPDLARSLNNLANRLSDLEQREAALAASHEAVDLRRKLATRSPGAFEPALAMSLNNLGVMSAATGQHEAALAATRESVDLLRELATRNPNAFQSALATSLKTLAKILSNVGLHDEALVANLDAERLLSKNSSTSI